MIKRMFDIFAVSIGIVLLSPFLLIIGLWIKFDSEGPVVFSQIRVGRYGVLFVFISLGQCGLAQRATVN